MNRLATNTTVDRLFEIDQNNAKLFLLRAQIGVNMAKKELVRKALVKLYLYIHFATLFTVMAIRSVFERKPLFIIVASMVIALRMVSFIVLHLINRRAGRYDKL